VSDRSRDSSRESDALRARVEKAVGALFELEAEIGRGGMAVVYRAKDRRLRRKVALKVLPPELAFRDDVKRRFLREAEMSAQLSHPNIVPIYTVEETDGIVYFAMGLVDGETLAEQLAREPRPSVERVREILREVAGALDYAHARHVVHRDVKPDNILIDKNTGRTLVSDFGIARAAEGDQKLTVTGIAVGTPAYMSPEQAMGEREVDGRSDIYALGIVGYQMLAGELPFKATNTPAMLMKHISERPKPLHELRPDLPANLIAAIDCAMAKGRDDRFANVGAFRDALEASATVSRVREAHPPTAGVEHIDDPADRTDRTDRASRRKDGMVIGWRFDPQSKDYAKEALLEWRDQQRAWKERVRHQRGDRGERRELRRTKRELRELGYSPEEISEAVIGGSLPPQTIEDRIRRTQRMFSGYATTLIFLGAINALTSPHFPWVLAPAIGIGAKIIARVSSLWVDGVPISRLFQRQPHADAVASPSIVSPRANANAGALTAPSRSTPPDLSGMPREVLDGPHGAAVREAAEAKALITDILAKLPPNDREMLPEILPTVDALNERVRSLAQGLHQLDHDASAEAIAKLEARIAAAKADPTDSADRTRRIELLERQLATLTDLATRRDTVAQQLESASMVLQTMKLDLLKLRSSGLDAMLDNSVGATQEARALSTDIGRVIDAANEVRKL
jgi:serine/threonine protein kinase